MKSDDKVWYQKIDTKKIAKETQDSLTLFIDDIEVYSSPSWFDMEERIIDFLDSLHPYFEDEYEYLRYREFASLFETKEGRYIESLSLDYRPHIKVVHKCF